MLRVLPAHERLDPGHAAVLDRDLRLVVQDELVRLERMPQLAEALQPVGRVGIARRVVDAHARVLALGLVHRDVRALDERGDVGPVVRAERDADARAELDRDAADDERALERAGEPQRELDGRAAVGQPAQQHRELVAAEPRERVAAPQRAAQPFGDVAQEPVAVVVAERVVDLLEPVEVDQQQADRPAAHPHPRGRPADAAVQRASGSAAR